MSTPRRSAALLVATACLIQPVACSLTRMHGTASPAARVAWSREVPMQTEDYAKIDENPFLATWDNPVSTFSIDVDTASYANVRRFLNGGTLPPPDAVRLEELVNYFHYDAPAAQDAGPVAARLETGPCPWAPDHRLLRISLAARPLPSYQPPPPRNLVFLIDVSGSMDMDNKLPLVKRALGLLAEHLTERDRVSLVVYAGAAGLVLPPTSGNHRARILDALELMMSPDRPSSRAA